MELISIQRKSVKNLPLSACITVWTRISPLLDRLRRRQRSFSWPTTMKWVHCCCLQIGLGAAKSKLPCPVLQAKLDGQKEGKNLLLQNKLSLLLLLLQQQLNWFRPLPKGLLVARLSMVVFIRATSKETTGPFSKNNWFCQQTDTCSNQGFTPAIHWTG